MKLLIKLLLVCMPMVSMAATLTWTDNNPSSTTYTVFRATLTCATAQSTDFITIANKLTVKTYTDTPQPGSYCYYIGATLGTLNSVSNKIDWTQPLSSPVLTITAFWVVTPWTGVVTDQAGNKWPASISSPTRDCNTCEITDNTKISWWRPDGIQTASIDIIGPNHTLITPVPQCTNCPNVPPPTCPVDYIWNSLYPLDCNKS